MLAVLVVAFVVQALAWAWVGAGLRRVRDAAPGPLADAAGERSEGGGAGAREGPGALPLSVVVAARDEAQRLPGLLVALAAQTHRPFEVVVVDDRSADGTAALAEDTATSFPVPLRVVRVEPGAPESAGLPPKKHALERGVEAARSARVAFTDADGLPGPEWLATLARWAAEDRGPGTGDGHTTADSGPPTAEGVERAGSPGRDPDDDALADGPRQRDGGAVLVGYGPYLEAPGWLNRFVRYETVTTAALAAAAVGHGRPWHAVGRNLSVPAALLRQLGGYAHSAGSLSGDDDLLVQEVARRGAAPVRYVWDAAGAVPSPAPPGWRAFWRQKRRHASAGAHYPRAVLVALGAFQASNLALWVGAPLLHALAASPAGWGLLAAKLLVQRTALTDAFDALGAEPDLRLWQPVLDGLSAAYQVAFAVLGALPTPKRW